MDSIDGTPATDDFSIAMKIIMIVTKITVVIITMYLPCFPTHTHTVHIYCVHTPFIKEK